MSAQVACAECAFRKGCDTWHEARNRVVSQISAAGPLPFACHQNLDWKTPFAELVPRGLVTLRDLAGDRQIFMCAGWKAAVAARQWPVDPSLRWYQRSLARAALRTFDRFYAGLATARELQRDLTVLGEYYRGPRAWQIDKMLQRRTDGSNKDKTETGTGQPDPRHRTDRQSL